MNYLIIENDDGLMVVSANSGQTPEQAALAHGGVVVDEVLYKNYDDAYDAMLLIPDPIDDLHQDVG